MADETETERLKRELAEVTEQRDKLKAQISAFEINLSRHIGGLIKALIDIAPVVGDIIVSAVIKSSEKIVNPEKK